MNALFKQVDITPIVFMRVVYGFMAFGEIMGLFGFYHLYHNTFDADAFHFTYHMLDWVKPLEEPYMSIVFILGLISSIGIILGKYFRLSCFITGTVMLYAFCAEQSLYLNHGYLMICMAFILMWFPMNRSFSLDVRKYPAKRYLTVPVYYQVILAFLMGVVYFYGGIAKLNPDWLRAQPMLMWMEYKRNLFLIGPFVKQDFVAWIMSYGGFLFDLTCPFLLAFRRTRKVGITLALSFHIINVMIFNIGAFPWLSLGLSLMFFPPDLIPRFLDWLSGKVGVVNRWRSVYRGRFEGYGVQMPIDTSKKRLMSVLFIALVSYNMLMPLRHHLYSGNVNWTEEGHKFAWRMMLRGKSGKGSFMVKDEAGKVVATVYGRDELTKRQRQRLWGHPDRVVQFAQYIGDKYEAEGYGDVSVHANVKVRLNDHKYQRFIDPEVDLREVEWKQFRSETYIMPFEFSPR